MSVPLITPRHPFLTIINDYDYRWKCVCVLLYMFRVLSGKSITAALFNELPPFPSLLSAFSKRSVADTVPNDASLGTAPGLKSSFLQPTGHEFLVVLSPGTSQAKATKRCSLLGVEASQPISYWPDLSFAALVYPRAQTQGIPPTIFPFSFPAFPWASRHTSGQTHAAAVA